MYDPARALLNLSPSGRIMARLGLVLGLAFVLVTISGCPSNPVTTAVTGKVTLEGKPVAGTITFLGPENKSAMGPIMDGKYTVSNPPVGKCKVTITGTGLPPPTGAVGVGKEIKDTDPSAKMKDKMPPTGGGEAPPAKYTSPDNGLTYEVVAGKNEKDFALTK